MSDDNDYGFWTTQQGQRLRVRDMDDRHLCNTIRFLERQERDAWRSANSIEGHAFNSEAAEYEAEREATSLYSISERFKAKREELLVEASYRGLKIQPEAEPSVRRKERAHG